MSCFGSIHTLKAGCSFRSTNALHTRTPLSRFSCTYHEGGARLLAKASFSTLTLSDVQAPGSSPLSVASAPDSEGIRNLRFGKAVRIDMPAVESGAGALGGLLDKDEGHLYLNDVVGGATSGDSFGFALYLLWMMTIYPLSVAVHLIWLHSPPGRAVSGDHDFSHRRVLHDHIH